MESPDEQQHPAQHGTVNAARAVAPHNASAVHHPTGMDAQPMDVQPQPASTTGGPASGPGSLTASPLTLWPLLAAAGSVLLLIGGAGPWINAVGLGEVGGSSGDGAIIIVLALLALVAAGVMLVPALAGLTWRRHLGWVITGLGLISVIVGLYDTAHIHQLIKDNDAEGFMHLGWGLVMTNIFSFVVTALGILTALTARRPHTADPTTDRMAAGSMPTPIGQNPKAVAARGALAGLARRTAQRLEPHAQQGAVQPHQASQTTPPAKAQRQWTMPEQN